MPQLERPPVMLDILEEHFEELDFLWEQREGVVFAPDWTLKELAELEERTEAHLDGLCVGQGHSVDIARTALTGEERGATTAAAFVFLALDRPFLDTEVLDAFKKGPPEARAGIRIALRHSPIDRLVEPLRALVKTGEPAVRAAAADVLAFHRKPAPPGFVDLLGAPDLADRKLAYIAAGRFGGPWSVDFLDTAFRKGDADLKHAAFETSARVGLPGLASLLRRYATQEPTPIPEALVFLGVLGDPQDQSLLEFALRRPPLARAALDGLGALGRAAAVPNLLKAMTGPTLAPDAGRAFVRLTGATGIEADQPLPPPPDLPEEEHELWDPVVPPTPSALPSGGRARRGASRRTTVTRPVSI